MANQYQGGLVKLLLFSGIIFFVVFPSFGQVEVGIMGGGNLSKAKGPYYRSLNKIGLQAGAFFTYHFTNFVALQAEPSFNISRIRTNDLSSTLPNGIYHGNKSLQFFVIPIHLKLKLSSNFALSAGPEYNKLLNGEDFWSNNGDLAFREGVRFGYGLGIEIGKIYFRYRNLKNFDNIGHISDVNMNQYQLGLRWKLF